MSDEGECLLSYVKGHQNKDQRPWERPGFVFLDDWAQTQADKEAHVFRPSAERRIAITYRTLSEATRKLAIWFAKMFAVKRGDRVAILSTNRPEYLYSELALSRLGAVSVRLFATVDSKSELTRALERTDARLLLSQSSSLNSVKLILPEVQQGLTKLEHVIVLDDEVEDDEFTKLPRPEELDFSDNDFRDLSEREGEVKMTDDCTIYSTSGSTGEPKFVVYSHQALMNHPKFFLERGGFDREDRYFSDRPMAHIGGLALRILPLGATMIIANPWKTVSGEDSYVGAVFNEERVTCGICFPYLLYDLARSDKITAKIKFLVIGGQKVNAEVLHKVKEIIDTTFINGYGTTELGEVCSNHKGDSMESVCKFVGLPTPGVEIKIVKENSTEIVPVGEIGKIAVRKDQQWRYLNDAKRMQECHDREGYFYPGDMGRMNGDSYLEILGRKDDVISVGTVKLYPSAIEKKLCGMTAVDKAVVFGVPDERLLEVVGAAVLPKDDEITSDDVMRYFSQSVTEADLTSGDIVLPKHVWIMDAFPQTSSGKVDKRVLRQICLQKMFDRQ